MEKLGRFYFFGTIVLLIGIMEFGVSAQTPTPSPSPTPSLEKQFLKNIWHDQKTIWTAPLRLERSDTKWMIPMGIGTMALFTTDRITGDEIAKFDDQRTASRIMSAPGSIYGVGAIAATFYAVGRKQHNSRARETGILIAQGSVNSLIVSSGLKLITQRVRPQTGVERSEFFDGGDSFPSGHSIQAWSMATIVANEYHDHRMVQVAAYGIAGAVSVARFTSGKHYISDAVIGSLIGYGIGKYVYQAHHRESAGSGDENDIERISHWPTIVPDYNRGLRQYSLGLSWSF